MHNIKLMYSRLYDPLTVEKTYFLLGPRQTGKSTLLGSKVSDGRYFDLLEPVLFAELSARPQVLIEMVEAAKGDKSSPFVIDEIQKLPSLLDTVQLILSRDKRTRFILTGSSARKLRRAGQNLLGGRARRVNFAPLTLKELSSRQKNPVEMAMKYGGLPGIRESKAPQKELLDYIGVYLQEEILAEAQVRNLGAFSRFLTVAGISNSEQINYEKVGSDAQVAGRTVKDYFDLLEDTLIGNRLESYRPTKSRKFVSAPKFYFFDVGVAHFTYRKSVESLGPSELGKAFEHLVYCELKAYISYRKPQAELYFWRTQTGNEVDFVVQVDDELVLIEAKHTKSPNERDTKGFRAFTEHVPKAKLKAKVLVCQAERARRTEDGCDVLPVMKFVAALWAGEII